MKRILVVGPGALGARVAAKAAAAGHEVTVACRSQATAESLRRSGVIAEEVDGQRVKANVAVADRPEDVKAGFDMGVLATKCAAAGPALELWRTAVKGPWISMQNGLMGETLTPIVPGRLVLCTVAFPATRIAIGHSKKTGPGHYIIGGRADTPSDVVSMAADVLATVDATETSRNIAGVQWTKLAANACINSVGALTGQVLGEAMRPKIAQYLFMDLMRETVTVGRANGVVFEPIHGLRPTWLAAPVKGPKRWLARQGIRVFAHKFRHQRSSSLQSLERGEKTEVDFLNGAIVAWAQRAGVATPWHKAVIAAIHAIEDGKRSPDPANLSRLRNRL